MRILLAGTVHWDPLCRYELRKRLEERRISEGKPPSFVAVEADYDHFRQLDGQRKTFTASARSDWPSDVSEKLIVELALTMLYEADTTIDIFTGVDIVWLDRGRTQREPQAVNDYPNTALSTYAPWITKRRESRAGFDVASTLRNLSSAMRLGVNDGPPTRDPGKDARWFAEMRSNLAKGGADSWAVVACGVEHTLDEDGNLARLLLDEGHTVLDSLDLASIFS